MSLNVIFETVDNTIKFIINDYFFQERVKNNVVEKVISLDLGNETIKKEDILVLTHESLKTIIINGEIIENKINIIPKVFTIEISNINLITNKSGKFLNIIMNYTLNIGENI